MLKKILLGAFVAVACFSATSDADAQTYVRGYYRSNGTYVQPHYRSYRDNSFYNNWSTWGNTNPYTGSRGYKRYPSYRYGW